MDAGLRAKDFAEMFGVTECTVYDWEVRGYSQAIEIDLEWNRFLLAEFSKNQTSVRATETK